MFICSVVFVQWCLFSCVCVQWCVFSPRAVSPKLQWRLFSGVYSVACVQWRVFNGVCSVVCVKWCMFSRHAPKPFHRCARTAIQQSASHREASVDTGTELMAALSTPPFGPRRYRPGSLGAGPGVPANGVCFVGPGPAPSGSTARLVAVQAVVWLWPSRQRPAVRSSRRTHSSSSATLLLSGSDWLRNRSLLCRVHFGLGLAGPGHWG